MNKLIFALIFFMLFLSACTQINEKDVIGKWVIDKVTFNGHPVDVMGDTVKIGFLHNDFLNKFKLKFKADSTVFFPGVIPCKWVIKNKQLIISFDTLRFQNDALMQLDSLGTLTMLRHDAALRKKYLYERDSILDIKNIARFNNPISIYTGLYSINETKDRLIITSPTTQIELTSFKIALKNEIDKISKF